MSYNDHRCYQVRPSWLPPSPATLTQTMFLDFGSAGQAATGCDEASFTRHGTCRFRTYLLDFQASSASVRCCRLPSLRWRRLDDSQFEIANSPTDVVAG